MSLRTIGYTPEGRAIRVDEGPSYAAEMKLRGSYVTGEPGWQEKARRQKSRTAEGQREYRARRKAA